MKKIIYTFLAAATLLGAASCEKSHIQLADLEVEVSFEEEFASESIEGVQVTITNVTDNMTLELTTDKSGKVLFQDITSGIYNVSAAKPLSDYLTLNAVKENVNVATETTAQVGLVLNGTPTADDFVIKEVYSCGSKVPGTLFKDSFIELYNNTDRTLYADGVVFAVLTGGSGQPGWEKIAFPLDEYCYSENVAMIPGSGKEHPVEPGKSLLIAFNAINFAEGWNEKAPVGKEYYVDLSGADFEISAKAYLEQLGFTHNAWFDLDNPKVPEVTVLYMSNQCDGAIFNIDGNGSSIVLLRDCEEFNKKDFVKSPTSTPTNIINYLRIPNKLVFDAVEILNHSGAGEFRKMDHLLDAGFTFLKADGKPNYTGMSSRRKMGENGKLIDTNNSSNDFESLPAPTPRIFK